MESGFQEHGSHVHLKEAGREPFSQADAARRLTLFEGAEIWVRNLATRPGPEILGGVLKPVHDARAGMAFGCRLEECASWPLQSDSP